MEEIVPVSWADRKGNVTVFEQDEFIKPTTTLEKLASLRPAFRKEGSTVTAGNEAGLNDRAAAMLLATEAGLNVHGITLIARIITSAVVGVEPRIMGIGPVNATKKALQKAGLTLEQMDVIEFNEAFAA